MSRGFGIVQRGIIDAFETSPDKRQTVEGLAKAVFPGMVVERKHMQSIRRALSVLAMCGQFKILSCRSGDLGKRGWCYSLRLQRL